LQAFRLNPSRVKLLGKPIGARQCSCPLTPLAFFVPFPAFLTVGQVQCLFFFSFLFFNIHRECCSSPPSRCDPDGTVRSILGRGSLFLVSLFVSTPGSPSSFFYPARRAEGPPGGPPSAWGQRSSSFSFVPRSWKLLFVLSCFSFQRNDQIQCLLDGFVWYFEWSSSFPFRQISIIFFFDLRFFPPTECRSLRGCILTGCSRPKLLLQSNRVPHFPSQVN